MRQKKRLVHSRVRMTPKCSYWSLFFLFSFEDSNFGYRNFIVNNRFFFHYNLIYFLPSTLYFFPFTGNLLELFEYYWGSSILHNGIRKRKRKIFSASKWKLWSKFIRIFLVYYVTLLCFIKFPAFAVLITSLSVFKTPNCSSFNNNSNKSDAVQVKSTNNTRKMSIN